MHAKKSAQPAAALALPRAPERTPDARDSFFLLLFQLSFSAMWRGAWRARIVTLPALEQLAGGRLGVIFK